MKTETKSTQKQLTFRKILNLKRKIYERKQWQKFSYSQKTVEKFQREIDKMQPVVEVYEAIHGEVR